jgi:hypothetical protein
MTNQTIDWRTRTAKQRPTARTAAQKRCGKRNVQFAGQNLEPCEIFIPETCPGDQDPGRGTDRGGAGVGLKLQLSPPVSPGPG